MKFTILHPNDRLASVFKQAKSIVKQLPLDEINQHWDKFVKNVTDKMNDTLQDQIEMLTMQLKDQEEALTDLRAIHGNLYLRNQELQTKLEAAAMFGDKFYVLQGELGTAEKQIVDLKAELKTQCENRDHFRLLVAQQDTFIKEIKQQIEAYKAAKQKELNEAVAAVKADLTAKTNEANHLAKQAVRLNEENATLTTKVNEINSIKEETLALIEENTQFKEQTTRLVEEKRKLTDQVNSYECRGVKTGQMGEYCGGCLGCIQMQTDHALHETSTALAKAQAELKAYKNISNLQATAMGTLYPIVRNLTNNWFPPKGVHIALSVYDTTCEKIALELDNIKPLPPKATVTIAPTPKSTTFAGPTCACCGDVNKVI